MVKFLLYLVLFWGILYLFRAIFRSFSGDKKGMDGVDDEMVNCPECATFFPSRMAVSRRAGGGRHSFCSPDCAEKFAKRGGPPGR